MTDTLEDAPHAEKRTAAPGPGRYRMLFEFTVDGTVHTAAWTAQVS